MKGENFLGILVDQWDDEDNHIKSQTIVYKIQDDRSLRPSSLSFNPWIVPSTIKYQIHVNAGVKEKDTDHELDTNG